MTEEEKTSETKIQTIIIDRKAEQHDKKGKEYKDRMVIRSFSSMILLIPTFVTTLILFITQLILNNRRGGIENPDHTINEGYMNIIGVIFYSVLTLNLILIAFDFDRMLTLILALLTITIVVVLILVNIYTGFIQKILANFPDFKIYLSTQFYFGFTLLLFFILLFTWLKTLFNYYIIEGNELIHRKGLGGGIERFPATNMGIKKEYPDIIEMVFFRSGTLYLSPPKVEHAIVLKNVIGVNKKVKEMNEILSRLKVDIN
ncbi:MAG: hypothetical protein JXA54_12240 [Candidatus Heimdallarchaeota archaeon]|nr:hypothetical protein [Candidatus Heimdallarchaeota archaeon]